MTASEESPTIAGSESGAAGALPAPVAIGSGHCGTDEEPPPAARGQDFWVEWELAVPA